MSSQNVEPPAPNGRGRPFAEGTQVEDLVPKIEPPLLPKRC